MNKRLLSYALEFASVLVDSLNEKELLGLKEIILFGSVARGEASKESDIDIFINVSKSGKNSSSIERTISYILNSEYKNSNRNYPEKIFSKKAITGFVERWKLMGMDNRINCIVGELNKWGDLKQSIISDGIILYGKYTGLVKGRSFVIISWDKIKPETKRVFLSKKLYGYNSKGKRYSGIIEGTGTIKLASNCIMVPLEDAKKVILLFKDYGIDVRRFHMSMMI
jgi:hypothetical protein